jgi:hypothetical protein
MRQRLRSHLTFANVASAIALFVSLAGGTAYATHLVVNSSDVVDNSLQSVDLKDNAGVKSADVVDDTVTGGGLLSTDIRNGEVRTGEIRDNAVRSGDVLTDSLTGADIENQSGVDNCTHGTLRFGELCFGALQTLNTWSQARQLCASVGLRLPSLGEAQLLAVNYDLPTVDAGEKFWTEESTVNSDGVPRAFYVTEGGDIALTSIGSSLETICVTTPTN